MLTKGYFIDIEEFDQVYSEWENSGKPDSFGNYNSEDAVKKFVRMHRSDTQNIKALVKNGFDPTGLKIGTGLPSPWSSYGHDLYMNAYPNEFKLACAPPVGEVIKQKEASWQPSK